MIFYSAGDVLYSRREGTVTLSLKTMQCTSSMPRSGGVLNGSCTGNTEL